VPPAGTSPTGDGSQGDGSLGGAQAPAGQLATIVPPPACEGIDLSGSPTNEVAMVEVEGGEVVSSTAGAQVTFVDAPIDPRPTATPFPEPLPEQKVHPVLLNWLNDQEQYPPTRPITVVVSLEENLEIPRFPSARPEYAADNAVPGTPGGTAGLGTPDGTAAPGAPADGAGPQPPSDPIDQPVKACTDALIEAIRSERAGDYTTIIDRLEEVYDATRLDYDPATKDIDFGFWLNRAVLVTLPIGQVLALAGDDDLAVEFIEPENAEERPPQSIAFAQGTTASGNTIVDARRVISDSWYSAYRELGTIAMLDTGIFRQHTSFDDAEVGVSYDCVNGDGTCLNHNNSPVYDADDSCWNHGTASADILVGNVGMTDMRLNSLKVYSTDVDGELCTDSAGLAGAERAFEAAFSQAQAHVILAEMQDSTGESAALAQAADNAFKAGRPVIAPMGNVDQLYNLTVASPAIAHRVIAVGGFDVTDLGRRPIQVQRLGHAPDGRIKPDLLAPTNSVAATNEVNPSHEVYGGTSGAAPYVAGAAALLWNRLRGTSPNIDPGLVYAFLILSGQTPYDDSLEMVGGFARDTGAGPIRLPRDGRLWSGVADLKPSPPSARTAVIDLILPTGTKVLDAALWWPEYHYVPHNNIDAFLLDGSTERAASTSEASVFERLRVESPAPAGAWKLRIQAINVDANGQFVYWAAYADTTAP